MIKLYGVGKMGVQGAWAIAEYKNDKLIFITSANNQKEAAQLCKSSPNFQAIDMENVEIIN